KGALDDLHGRPEIVQVIAQAHQALIVKLLFLFVFVKFLFGGVTQLLLQDRSARRHRLARPFGFERARDVELSLRLGGKTLAQARQSRLARDQDDLLVGLPHAIAYFSGVGLSSDCSKSGVMLSWPIFSALSAKSRNAIATPTFGSIFDALAAIS